MDEFATKTSDAIIATSPATRSADACISVVLTRADATLKPGQMLGRYTVLGVLGQGAMGTVYRVYDPILTRTLAVKSIHPWRLSVREHQRLKAEGCILARVDHPNVLRVYDVSELSGRLAIVMELIEGVDLWAWQTRPRPWREVVSVYRQAGAGLAAAHRAGVLHRDFKPANAMLNETGRVVVIDFGVAQAIEGISRSGGAPRTIGLEGGRGPVGTPLYMAPEQHYAEQLGPASDQYAFCLALWEALCGSDPFTSGSLRSLAEAKRLGPPPWPERVRVPRCIREAIRRGLAPEPKQRFATMEDLLSVLGEGLAWRPGPFVFAVSMAAVCGAWGWTTYVERNHRCSGADAEFAGVWNAATQRAVSAALDANSAGYARADRPRVLAGLGRYARSWKRQWQSACEDTTWTRRQSSAVMELRLNCLRRHRGVFAETVEVLLDADETVAKRASSLVAELPALAGCSDVATLRAELPPPRNANEAAQVERVRELLSAAKVRKVAGQPAAALDYVEVAQREIAGSHYLPVLAELRYVRGLALAALGHYEHAERTFTAAFEQALASGHSGIAVDAAAELAAVLGFRQERLPEGLLLASLGLEQARAYGHVEQRVHALLVSSAVKLVAARPDEAERHLRQALQLQRSLAEHDPIALAQLSFNLGNALYDQGRYAEAVAAHRETLALQQHALAAGHPVLAATHNSLAIALMRHGEFEEAESQFKQSLAIYDTVYRPGHPSTGLPRMNLGWLLLRREAFSAAELQLRQALAIYERALEPDHRWIITTLHRLGHALAAQGRNEEARRCYDRVLRSRLHRRRPPGSRGGVAFALAKVLGPEEQDRALDLARQALRDLSRADARFAETKQELVHWLAQRERLRRQN